MLHQFLKFKELFDNKKIEIKNVKLNTIFYSYSFFHITDESKIDENQTILQNIKDSKVAIINQFTGTDHDELKPYFIVSFNRTIIIIQISLENIRKKILLNAPNIAILNFVNAYFANVEESHNIIEDLIKNHNNLFNQEINSFFSYFITNIPKDYEKISDIILKCIAGYLISEGHISLRCNNESDFFTESKKEPIIDFDEKDFIEIRPLSIGSSFIAELVYHIERKKLFVIKSPNNNNDSIEEEKLLKRENENYQELHYFNLPKYYGKIKGKNYPVIEFIEGENLINIEELKLDFDDKINIIFQIMLIIKYLHSKKFVYRDLKPDNVIVDKFKRIFLIDFDRMIKYNEQTDCCTHIQTIFQHILLHQK